MTESSMTAVVEYGPNQLKLESVPIPTAAANEVVIEVEACGVCTSDVKAWHGAPRYWGGNGQPKWIREPVVPGHEFIGHIVELGSEVEGFALGERVITQGVKNILAKNPDIKLLAIQPANWDRTQAYNLMQDWISRYGAEIKGVIAENDDMGIGAIRALEEKGLAGKIPVGGVDAIKDGLREVKSGNMVATNLQNAAIELGMALQATVDLLDNKQVPQTALLNMPVIKKDKVDYYYSQLYVKPQDFLKTLPDLIKKNMASGDYASQ
jgi:ABC-type sugar transport system substrate-binding protein